MLLLILLVLLVLFFAGGVSYAPNYGPYGYSPAAIILLILILAVVFGWHL